MDSIDFVVVSIGKKSQAEDVKGFLLDAGIRDVIWALDIPEYHFTHTSKKIIYESTRETLSCESQILEAYKFEISLCNTTSQNRA